MKIRIGLLLALLISSVSYAESTFENEQKPAPIVHQPFEVYLSSPDYTFDAQVTALILQPTGSDIYYFAHAKPLPLTTPNWTVGDVKTDYHFGFDLELAGIFHTLNTNLSVNWEHFFSSDSSEASFPNDEMVGPFFVIGPDASTYISTKGKAQFIFNEINSRYGTEVSFGNRARSNFFTGVGYTYLKQSLTSEYFSSNNTDSRSIQSESSFSGAGPQVGMSYASKIFKGLYLTGDASASFLVGTLKNSTTYKSFTPLLTPLGITPPNTQTTGVDDRIQVVPAIDGQLGLSYIQSFCKNYMVSLEAGYRVQVYFNAIQTTDMGSEVPINSQAESEVGVFARSFERNISNYAMAGPYISLKFGF